jgi:MFS family permease
MSAVAIHVVRRLPLARPLAVRDFRLLWVGEIISMTGSSFTSVALAWLALQLTGSGLALGTVLLVGSIPRIVLILIGGAITDRYSAWRVALIANTILGVTMAALAALTILHLVQLWQLYTVALITGASSAFFFPAIFSLVPRTLDAELLGPGNALMEAANGVTSFLGPAAAGVLIATIGRLSGTGAAFAVDAASFGVAMMTLLLMSSGIRLAIRSGEPAAVGAAHLRELLRLVWSGLTYAWRDAGLRAFLLILTVANLCFYGPYQVGLAALAAHRFSQGAAALGILYGAWGAGSLLGTLVAGLVGRVRRYGLLLIAGPLVYGICFTLIGFAPTLAPATVLVVIIGISSGINNVIFATWLQVRTAPSMLGRVTSLLGLAGLGLTPLSYALSGFLVDVNPTLTFVLAGGILFAVAGVAATQRAVRTME